jgi:hypothetical protein
MDPISAAIIAALIAGATKVGERALNDAYSGLKTLILRKFGGNSELALSVEAVERAPDSEARKQVLQEEVFRARADQDAQIRRAAQTLLDQIAAKPGGQQLIRDVMESGMIVGGDVSADRGGTVIGRDNISVLPEGSARLPQTTIGWIITVPALICVLVGFLIAALNIVSVFNDGPRPGEGFPDGVGLGMGLFFIGIVVGAVGGVIDQVLSRPSKR